MKKLLTAAALALGMNLPMSAQTSYQPVELSALQVEEMFMKGIDYSYYYEEE